MFTSKALLDTAIEMAPEESTSLLQKWLNHGNTQLNAAFNRYWNRVAATADVVASQQYYQLPEDCIKVISIAITNAAGTTYVLQPIENEDDWRALISGGLASSAYPQYYFVRGADEVGIFPKPPALITNGLEVSYLPRQNDWRFTEYNSGTVTVNAASGDITLTGGTFLQQQIGMSFKVDDGTHDRWYKINEYVSGSLIRIENNYGGISGSGRPYIIGEIPIIPDEFHENILDYAMFRHHQKMGNSGDAKDFMALFNDAKTRLIADYATKTNNQVIRPRGRNAILDPFTRIPDIAHL